MNAIEYVIIFVIVVLLAFVGISTDKSVEIRQEIYQQKTGKTITWWEALNYPDNYFTDATVKITN